jgi:hypothetical protein
MNSAAWLWSAMEPELKAEIVAGRYDEQYPALRQLYLDGEAHEAQKRALRLACEDVVFDSKTRTD